MKKYVVGFLLNGDEVCLIEKTHPDWQKGKLNGVGGHIEKDEVPAGAMCREFAEEAGVYISSWRLFTTLHYPDCDLYCFECHCGNETASQVETKTDEKIGWYSTRQLPSNIIPNLFWIIPMAQCMGQTEIQVLSW